MSPDIGRRNSNAVSLLYKYVHPNVEAFLSKADLRICQTGGIDKMTMTKLWDTDHGQIQELQLDHMTSSLKEAGRKIQVTPFLCKSQDFVFDNVFSLEREILIFRGWKCK